MLSRSPGSAIYSGTTASALNRLIANSAAAEIQLAGSSLSVDQPIEIQRTGVTLNLGTTSIAGANPQSYMLRIENTSNVTVKGGIFASGDSAILVNNATGVVVSGVQVENLTGAGIVVTGSTDVNISGNTFSGLGLAGIMVHRGTTQSMVQHNQISGGSGYSNMMAGIVITDREVDLTTNPRAILGPDGYWVITQPITERQHPPHDNLIAWNTSYKVLHRGSIPMAECGT